MLPSLSPRGRAPTAHDVAGFVRWKPRLDGWPLRRRPGGIAVPRSAGRTFPPASDPIGSLPFRPPRAAVAPRRRRRLAHPRPWVCRSALPAPLGRPPRPAAAVPAAARPFCRPAGLRISPPRVGRRPGKRLRAPGAANPCRRHGAGRSSAPNRGPAAPTLVVSRFARLLGAAYYLCSSTVAAAVGRDGGPVSRIRA